jgi:flagellar biosynthesis protein FlhF
MQIKRYEAKNMTTALRMIKDELGPDAVILSARSLRKGKGFFGSMKYAGVVVSAAIDNQQASTRTTNLLEEESNLNHSKKTRFVDVDQINIKRRLPSAGYAERSRIYRQQLNRSQKDRKNEHDKTFSSLYQQILAQEVDRGVASEIIEEIKRIPGSRDLVAKGDFSSHLSSILEEMGVLIDKNTFVNESPKIIVFIGTTGVGKTTTIAKLAAQQANRNKKRVALITLDNYGISAMAQLGSYAQIIGVPLETAANKSELKRAIKNFKDKDLILIDTPGIGPKDQRQIHELKACINKLAGPQIHLVLSATTKEKDFNSITENFKDLGFNRLLFTKVDESSAIGNIVNLLIRTNTPLSFLCNGRKVPGDIEAGSIHSLVELLLASTNEQSQQQHQSYSAVEIATTSDDNPAISLPYFVANKNSDVYHRPDCKRSKKIKSDNIIRFASWQEADEQNFLPCRSCNPDRFQSDSGIDAKIEKRKISTSR